MAKKKQPYIPIYTGDYLKDTRALSLEAKGAWMDLILFIWINGQAGIIEGTMEDFARMVGTSEMKFASVLLELERKNICDVHGERTKVFKVVCRRLAKEAEISAIRSEVGSKGGSKTQAKGQAKSKQKSDNDIDNDNEVGIKSEKELISISENQTLEIVPQETFIEQKLSDALDEIYIDRQRPKWSHINFDFELEAFRTKVRGSPEFYMNHDKNGIQLALQSQLRNAKHRQPEKKIKKELTLEELKAARNGHV